MQIRSLSQLLSVTAWNYQQIVFKSVLERINILAACFYSTSKLGIENFDVSATVGSSWQQV
jgi:hypothetical protein